MNKSAMITDPIFAAIEQHRTLVGDIDSLLANGRHKDDQLDIVCDQLDGEMRVLESVQPTTLEGVLAAVRYQIQELVRLDSDCNIERDPAGRVLRWVEKMLTEVGAPNQPRRN